MKIMREDSFIFNFNFDFNLEWKSFWFWKCFSKYER